VLELAVLCAVRALDIASNPRSMFALLVHC
jgi:hypothetical protein